MSLTKISRQRRFRGLLAAAVAVWLVQGLLCCMPALAVDVRNCAGAVGRAAGLAPDHTVPVRDREAPVRPCCQVMSHSEAAAASPPPAAAPRLAAASLGHASPPAIAPLRLLETRLAIERAHPPPAYLRNSVLRI